jgi:glycosyltransferase involved in cell wall biosynthesis
MNSRKPKILILSEVIPPLYSGAGRSATEIAEYLYCKNQLSFLLTRTKKIKDFKDRIPENKIIRVPFLQTSFLRSNNKPVIKLSISMLIYPYLLIFSLIFIIKHRNNFDIAFCVSPKWFSLFLTLFCKFFGKNIVLETTLVGQDDPYLTDTPIITKFIKSIRVYQFRLADKINNISIALADRCRAAKIKENKISLIPRSVDPRKYRIMHNKEELKTKLLGSEYYYPIILFAGGLTKRKGIDIVYETSKILGKYFSNLLVLLAGPTPYSGRDYIEEYIIKDVRLNNLTKKIRLLGAIDNLEEYMNISHLFFFPSRREGFGRVFVEAMACGLPVVCKNIPGITNFIFDSDTEAVVLDSENAYDYAEKILFLLNNTRFYKKIKESALLKYENKFEHSKIMDLYSELFDSIYLKS